HEPRLAVDLGGARAALAGLAVPAHGEVVGLVGLHPVHRVEHDHALGDGRDVVLELPARPVAAPDAQGNHAFLGGRRGRGRLHFAHYFISAITCFNSAGISRIGTSASSILPSADLRTTRFTLPHFSALSWKSSRKWPPRLSFRISAQRVIASEMVSRL